jgi:hypothetical protein
MKNQLANPIRMLEPPEFAGERLLRKRNAMDLMEVMLAKLVDIPLILWYYFTPLLFVLLTGRVINIDRLHSAKVMLVGDSTTAAFDPMDGQALLLRAVADPTEHDGHDGDKAKERSQAEPQLGRPTMTKRSVGHGASFPVSFD